MVAKEGKAAPDFSLPDETGKIHRLSDYRGKTVVLYFYPKDDTPGCTVEACNFRDDYLQYRTLGTTILGISPDNEKSHTKFKKKFSLPFPLLADVDHKVAEKYGAWGEKKLYGRTYDGLIRSTFVIDPEGKIAKEFPKVKVKEHSNEVLEVLEAIQTQ
ncbi:MAG: thioredoxin-dependent thiol peroxidase [Anaerolineales bacterium]